MPYGKRRDRDAVILLAKGYDEGFVNQCVGELREAGIDTDLVGLESRYITSLHGVGIQADEVLRNWNPTEKTRLIVVPGGAECVTALAREPKVPELVRRVLSQDGWVAVEQSAESTLERQKEIMLPDQHILPPDIVNGHYLSQGNERTDDFIRSLIQRILP